MKSFRGAVIHQFLIIAEAANKVSREYQHSRPGIPWRGMTGMRNKLIHDYFRVDADEIWKTICDDPPALKRMLEEEIYQIQ